MLYKYWCDPLSQLFAVCIIAVSSCGTTRTNPAARVTCELRGFCTFQSRALEHEAGVEWGRTSFPQIHANTMIFFLNYFFFYPSSPSLHHIYGRFKCCVRLRKNTNIFQIRHLILRAKIISSDVMKDLNIFFRLKQILGHKKIENKCCIKIINNKKKIKKNWRTLF